MWLLRPTAAVLAVLLVGGAVARADEPRKPAEEPDLGFLEFLGSVDRLSDVMPDYLSQADPRGKRSHTAAAATAATPECAAQRLRRT